MKHKNETRKKKKKHCQSHAEKLKTEEKGEKEEVKWSKAIKEIEGMKVRDGENKIMEGGREIEKGTLGSWSKSV